MVWRFGLAIQSNFFWKYYFYLQVKDIALVENMPYLKINNKKKKKKTKNMVWIWWLVVITTGLHRENQIYHTKQNRARSKA